MKNKQNPFRKTISGVIACSVLAASTLFTSTLANAYGSTNINSDEKQIYRTIQSDSDNWIENDPIYSRLDSDKKPFYKHYLSTIKDDFSARLFSKLISITLKQVNASVNSTTIYQAYRNTRDLIFLNSHPFIAEEKSLVAARFDEEMVRCFSKKQNVQSPPFVKQKFFETNQACTIITFSKMSPNEFGEYLTVRMESEIKALVDSVDKISKKSLTYAPFKIREYEGRENMWRLLSPSWKYFSQEDKQIVNDMLDAIDNSHDPVLKRSLRRYIWFIALGNERNEARKNRFAHLFVNYPYYSLVDGL